jgi:hypothetical protein
MEDTLLITYVVDPSKESKDFLNVWATHGKIFPPSLQITYLSPNFNFSEKIHPALDKSLIRIINKGGGIYIPKDNLNLFNDFFENFCQNQNKTFEKINLPVKKESFEKYSSIFFWFAKEALVTAVDSIENIYSIKIF